MDANQKRQFIEIANDLILKEIPIPLLAPDGQYLPFVKALEQHLLKLRARNELWLPNLHKHIETISVYSDYGGESHNSKYCTYSFLFVGHNALSCFLEGTKDIRAKHSLDDPYKEMAFKDMGYGPASRALPEWLRNAELAPGLLFTIVVDKNVPSLCGAERKKAQKEASRVLEETGFGKWKPPIAEKLIIIAHLIGYWCAVLSRKGQNIFWMTDNDAIAANESQKDGCPKFFNNALNQYARFPYEKVATATEFDENSAWNDLLSLSDLVAGSIESFFSKSAVTEDVAISEQTNAILMWLAHQGLALKKLTMSIQRRPNNTLGTAITEFRLNEDRKDVEYVPIWF